jgi:hypothetical protein
MFQSLLASLWSPLHHFLGDCVKTWPGTLVHILIDINFTAIWNPTLRL